MYVLIGPTEGRAPDFSPAADRPVPSSGRILHLHELLGLPVGILRNVKLFCHGYLQYIYSVMEGIHYELMTS